MAEIMYNFEDVSHLLDKLEFKTADELEDQRLDFKEWNSKSKPDAIKLAIEMAVCMGNGGGGIAIFGVKDKVKGRSNAILGVPSDIDINLLMKAIVDSTDPKIIPNFKELKVPEGTGRLLVMQVVPTSGFYTTTLGMGKIRMGKECIPLTGSMVRYFAVELTQKSLWMSRPVEFRTEIKKDYDKIKLILYFKNNTQTPLQIQYYRIQITKGDKIKHSTGFKNRVPVFHTYSRIIYPSGNEQAEEFDWINPREWNIIEKGEYQVQTEIIYYINGKEEYLSYPLILNF